MKIRFLTLLAALQLSSMAQAQNITTDTFGTGTNQFRIDFVKIGNQGNSNDTTGYGGVPYEYLIGKYAICQSQIDTATRNGLQNVTAGAWSGDQPAANISWYEAASYVNWLNTSQGYRPAYNLTFTNGAWRMALWPTTPDATGNVAWTQGGTNLYRNANCVYFLPSENESYKAAYYDPAKNGGVGGYWLYPTGSDYDPIPVASGTVSGNAVYNQPWSNGPAAVFQSGGLSPYGTMGQGGNVWQWQESAWNNINDEVQKDRVIKGGSWGYDYIGYLKSSVRNNCYLGNAPSVESYDIGFRVARKATPPPPSIILPTTDTFGTETNQFGIDFVTIGNPGNTDDSTGYGGVPYTYRIGKYTISQNQIDAAVRNGLQNVTAGAWSGDQPAANISWYEAAAYVNWLNTSQGYRPAYNLTYTNGAWSMALWPTSPDMNGNVVWTLGATNLFRNALCRYFLPNENEWYKAAYYDPNKNGGSGGYWLYPTGSDTAPIALASGTAAGTAVYNQPWGNGPAAVDHAGGPSPYGTIGQGGNIWQWMESDHGTGAKDFRGGDWCSYWYHNAEALTSVSLGYSPTVKGSLIGFRIVSKDFLSPTNAQSISFPAIPILTLTNGAYTLGATADSGLPVSYAIGDTTVAGITNGTLIPLGVGTTTVVASQAGDTNYQSATPVTNTLVVTLAQQTVTPTAVTTRTYGSLPFGLTLPTNAYGLPVAPRIVSGPATLSGTNIILTGTGTVTLAYEAPGNDLYAAASVTNSFAVTNGPTNLRSQTITFKALAAKAYGSAPQALAGSASSKLPVTYWSSNTNVAVINGTNAVITGAGSTVITAYQPGDGSTFNPAAPVSQTLLVNQASQKLTLKAPKSVAYGSTPAAITATSSAGLPVTLTSSDPSIATITNSGTNTLLVPTGVGTITLTASQSGNTNVGAAIPVGQPIVITPGIQTITFGALTTNTYGAAPMTLTATSSAGLPVTFTASATNVASISGNTLTITGAGSAKITASQAGSKLWAPAKAITQTLTVAKASQTISFSTPSTVTFTNGGLVTLGATASSGLPVAYKSGNTKVLSITGSTCVITGRGTTTVVASQPGGANYLPATAITNTITVQ